MKKSIVYFSLLLMIVCGFSSFTATISFAESYTYYAKVNSDNIYFYSQPIDSDDSRLFIIPRTYFVKLISYQDDNFYYAQYDNLFGYVRIGDVVVMNGVPTNPYATSEFRVFIPNGLGLYASPIADAENKIVDVPYLCETIKFYGERQGEQYVPEKSDTWYYCCYQGESDYYGYLYSVFCDKVDTIVDNNQTFDIVDNPIFQTNPQSPSGLSTTAMILIIIGVSIPCLVVFYLLIKPTWAKDKVLNEKPKLARRKRHGDYFEFDDNELN